MTQVDCLLAALPVLALAAVFFVKEVRDLRRRVAALERPHRHVHLYTQSDAYGAQGRYTSVDSPVEEMS